MEPHAIFCQNILRRQRRLRMSEGMEMFFNAIDVEECEVSSIEEQGTITTNSLLKRVAK